MRILRDAEAVFPFITPDEGWMARCLIAKGLSSAFRFLTNNVLNVSRAHIHSWFADALKKIKTRRDARELILLLNDHDMSVAALPETHTNLPVELIHHTGDTSEEILLFLRDDLRYARHMLESE
eukprot:6193628-Pleurochrysis_carterae.AAC.1